MEHEPLRRGPLEVGQELPLVDVHRTPLLQALLRPELGFSANLDLSIHPSDEMLRYMIGVYGGDWDRGMAGYLDSGRQALAMTEQIVKWRFGGFEKVKMLDFASGYGRVTRHLLGRMDVDQLTVSDLMAPAVNFQHRVFGVEGVVSSVIPEDLPIHRDYDVVQAISLFSHLPEDLFRRWMRALWGLTRPGGMLIFSVHDNSLREDGRHSERISFVPTSENEDLDPTAYGSTWVSQSFVEDVISEELGEFPCHRLPRGLCGYQDVYVVVREHDCDFSSLDSNFVVEGYVDAAECDGSSHLICHGWAASVDRDREVDSIDLLINGQVIGSTEVKGPRPDVVQHYTDERLQNSGWALDVELGSSVSYSQDAAMLVARTSGESTILAMGCIYSLLADTARANINAMKAATGS